MRKLLFVLLLLTSCQTEEICNHQTCFNMEISNMLPIQFWLNGTPTFNEKNEAGIEKICFHQLLNCSDDVRIIFTDDPDLSYELQFLDIHGELLHTESVPEPFEGIYDLSFKPEDYNICELTQIKIVLAEEVLALNEFEEDLEDWDNEGGTEEFENPSFDSAIAPEWYQVNIGGPGIWSRNIGQNSVEYAIIGSVVGGITTDILAHTYIKSNRQARTIDYTIRWDAFIGDGAVTEVSFYVRYFKEGVQVGVDQLVNEISDSENVDVIFSFVTAETDFDEIGFYFIMGGTSTDVDGTVACKEFSPQLVTLPDWVWSEDVGSGTPGSALATIGAVHDTKLLSKDVSPTNTSRQLAIDIEYFKDSSDENAELLLYLTDGSEVQEVVISSGEPVFGLFTKTVFVSPQFDYGKIQLKAFLTEESIFVNYIKVYLPSVEIAKSDYLDIRTYHRDTRLVNVSNQEDFAGVPFSSYEEKPRLQMRIKSKFYRTRNPEENESEDMTDGRVEKLAGSVKRQKRLEVDPMTPYNNYKLALMLQCNSIYIDNQSWVKEGSIEEEEIHPQFGLFKSDTWLTLMEDGFISNVG